MERALSCMERALAEAVAHAHTVRDVLIQANEELTPFTVRDFGDAGAFGLIMPVRVGP